MGQVEAGEMKERRDSKEKKKQSCSAQKEVTDVLNRKLASAPEYTHTHIALPLRFNTGADASQ